MHHILLFLLQTTGKRGRPCAWKILHPNRGQCRVCALCHRQSEQGRYTHPAFWRRGEQSKMTQLGIQLASCICFTCHTSKVKTGLIFRSKVLEPSRRGSMGVRTDVLMLCVCVCAHGAVMCGMERSCCGSLGHTTHCGADRRP